MREFDGNTPHFDPLLTDPVSCSLTQAREALRLEPDRPLKIVVAVSGGEDSVVLLDLLLGLSKLQPLRLTVAHFDHGLRPESGDEAWFVERLAQRCGLPYSVQRAAPRTDSGNVEAWAREARYKFLEQVRLETESDLIATAHHRLDQVETFLFRLITGRLSSGAQGIRPIDLTRRLIRPLIEVDKNLIEEYGLRRQLSFVFDSSNADLTRTRNRIRHHVIPLLGRINPGLVSSLTVVADRLGGDDRYLETAAIDALESAAGEISVGWLSGISPVLQWRILRLIAQQQLGPAAREIGYDSFHRVVRSLGRSGPRYSIFELGRGIRCRVDRRGGLSFFHWGNKAGLTSGSGNGHEDFESGSEDILEPAEVSANESADIEPGEDCELAAPLPIPRTLAVPGDLALQLADKSRIKITARLFNVHEIDVPSLLEKLQENSGSYQDQASAIFDYSVVQRSELAVRPRHPGDRIVIWGRGGRKVKKVFQEHQVMLTLRDCLPIVLCNDNVLWIPGVARSQFAPVTENTTLILQLIYSRILSI